MSGPGLSAYKATYDLDPDEEKFEKGKSRQGLVLLAMFVFPISLGDVLNSDLYMEYQKVFADNSDI